MSDYEGFRLLQALTLACTSMLLLIWPLRATLLRMGSPILAYTSWLLLPLALVACMVPHPAAELSHVTWSAPVTVASSAPPLPPQDAIRWQALALAVWSLGAASTLLLFGWQQLQFRRQLGRLQMSDIDGVAIASSAIFGPLVIGLLNPRIVVPMDFFVRYDAQERSLILAHERVHLQRGDLYANAVAALLQVGFWFHPLVHLAAARFRFDQELACDSAVLQQHGGLRQTYAETILKTQLTNQRLPIGCHWHSHHPLKERIMQLTNPRPTQSLRRTSHLLLAALAIGSSYAAWALGPNEVQSADLALPPPTPVAAIPALPPVPASADIPPPPPPPRATPAVKAPAPPPPPTPPAEIAPSAPSEAPTAAATEYGVDLSHMSMEYEGEKLTKSRTVTSKLRVTAGRKYTISPGEGGHGCVYQLIVSPHHGSTGEALAFVDLQFKCYDTGATSGHPKLLAKLGQPATVRVESPDHTTHEITMTITNR